MKTKRIKATGLTNRIDFECTVDRCSYIDTELRTLKAERDMLVQGAQAIHADLIKELEDEQKAKAALCEKYAEEHRAELLPDEKKAKSAETPLSTYGFRTATPSLKTLSKVTWDQVVTNIRTLRLPQFLRVIYEADKQKLLAAQTTAPLSEIGVRVCQPESFFIEAKVDGAGKIKTEAA